MLIDKPRSRGGAVVSTPDPLHSLKSLALPTIAKPLSLQDREFVSSNPTHGACYSFFACVFVVLDMKRRLIDK